MSDTMTNAQIAELLAVESATAEGNNQKALRRASRLAYAWPVEASELLRAGRSVTELPGVGPWIAGRIASLVEEEPEPLTPPAIRDGFMTFADAQAALASDASWSRAVKGDLQMHTVYSDGRETIEDMARAGMDLGYEYVAVTDHSKGLRIAGGIDEETLACQIHEIDALNGRLATEGRGFRVLRSLEMNLKPDGTGDMDPEALGRLDLVLGSFHSSLRVKEDQTDRYLAALENPDIDVLGHPRGRMYNFRVGLNADWAVVFQRAAEVGKAVEIDCFPYRQDLDVRLLCLARDAGVMVSIGTDAHNTTEMQFIPIGLAAAKAAGVPKIGYLTSCATRSSRPGGPPTESAVA
jgi:histidinol phosphatase-like PHP family hydrolase